MEFPQLYKNDEGAELIVNDANHASLSERYGFKPVGPYVEATKGRKQKTEE